MKVSVLINNYNYAEYVAEAVESVLKQSHQADEIVIVDDGSTDGSSEVLRRLKAKHPNIVLHEQENRGQLAAMEAAVMRARGDLLFFLDADDCYEPHHVEAAVTVFRNHPEVGFYFSNHRQSSGTKAIKNGWGQGILGPSAYITHLGGARIGTITSTFAMHRGIATLLFPFDKTFLDDWRIRADDCLVWGASFAGAIKYYNPDPTVFYRVHQSNNFAGQQHNAYKNYLYDLRRSRFLQHFAARFGITTESAAARIGREFRLNPAPGFRVYRSYRRAVRGAPLPFFKKIRFYRQITSHYLKKLLRRGK